MDKTNYFNIYVLLIFLLPLRHMTIAMQHSPIRTRRHPRSIFRSRHRQNISIAESANALFTTGDMVYVLLSGPLFATIGQISNKANEYGEFRVQFRHTAAGITVASLRKIPRVVILPINKHNELATIESLQHSMTMPQSNTMLLLPMEREEYVSSKWLYLSGYFEQNYELITSASALLRTLRDIQSAKIAIHSPLLMDVNAPKIMHVFYDFIKICDPLVLFPIIDQLNGSNKTAQIIIDMSAIYHLPDSKDPHFYPYRPLLLQTEADWQAKQLKFKLLFNRLLYRSFDLELLIKIVEGVLGTISYDSP
eukprot:456775_1